MMPILLLALEFQSNNANNALHRPVIEALALLKRYATVPSTQPYFALSEVIPLDGVVRSAWREFVVKRDKDGRERVNRINYEIAVLQILREKLRCKEVWVAGADRRRNPDDDLPADFAAQRETYYTMLQQPLLADTFIADLLTISSPPP